MKKKATRDMTSGNIFLQLILFSVPLLIGNVFQLLYNTVDTYVVGNFVGKEALAAVGSTAMIINIAILFFNGLSIGAGVTVSRYFGERNMGRLHDAIETTMTMTLALCVVFTIICTAMVKPMLLMMSTPEDVFADASIYLNVYMMGISGVLLYNMASGILRAVGDTTRPLYTLIFASIVNVVLDLLFVVGFDMGVAGVAWATVISQLASAVILLYILTKTEDIYRLDWKELHIDKNIMKQILAVGLPTAIQSMITCVSNVFVQAYINVFGSAVVAGWSCFSKIEQFIILPMDSMAKSITTFVSQNIGARKEKRANKGTIIGLSFTVGITLLIVLCLITFAVPIASIFTKEKAVVEYCVIFINLNAIFCIANCINHPLAGALRGRGDSAGPTIIMICSFVLIRQIYLFVSTRFFANTPEVVAFGYPVGWTACCIIEIIYFIYKMKKRNG